MEKWRLVVGKMQLRKINWPHCVVRRVKRRRAQCAHSRKIRATRNLPIKNQAYPYTTFTLDWIWGD